MIPQILPKIEIERRLKISYEIMKSAKKEKKSISRKTLNYCPKIFKFPPSDVVSKVENTDLIKACLPEQITCAAY